MNDPITEAKFLASELARSEETLRRVRALRKEDDAALQEVAADLETALAENERLLAVVAEAGALCRAMDRGVGYRVSGDHSTWDEYTEGKSDFAFEVADVLNKAVRP